MTIADLVERAKRRLNAGSPEPHTWVEQELELAACIDDAAHELAVEVMKDRERRAWLQQVYSITLNSSGVSTNLLTATGSITSQTAEILLEGIHYGTVVDLENNTLVPLFNYADFLSPQITNFGYYILVNQTIATRAINTAVNSSLDIVGVTGPLTVTTSFVPKNVSDWPLQLTDDLVAKLCEVVSRKMPAVE